MLLLAVTAFFKSIPINKTGYCTLIIHTIWNEIQQYEFRFDRSSGEC